MSTYRIPPSLNWLIRNRRVIAGRLQIAAEEKSKIEDNLEQAKKLIQRYDIISQQITVLEQDLAAIDRSLSLHEIQIDISQLECLRPHRNTYFFKRGVLVQSIFTALSNNPNTWLSTTEIAVLVKFITGTNIAADEFPRLRSVVRNRLNGLVYKGKIDNVNTGKLNKEGFWRLKPSDRNGITYSEVPSEVDSLANILGKTQIDLI